MHNKELSRYPGKSPWPAWQKLLFSFLFVYFILFIEPWTWIDYIPYAGRILKYYFQLKSWVVNGANDHVFHTYQVLVSRNGSGDTSFGWTELKLDLLLAVLGGIIWSIIDRRATDYNRAAYWFRQLLRFSLIINCFLYGIDKLFMSQMPFPTLSQLATPLGDLLPMRLSWLFIGYSGPYQSFLGVVEVIAGLLLFFRRTTTLGALLSMGIFANVAMMNLSYDIPVKIFSIHLFIMSFILLAFDSKRLFSFFIANTSSTPSFLYDVRFPLRRMRIGRWLFKYAFIGFSTVFHFQGMYSYFQGSKNPVKLGPIHSGFYNVHVFAVNKDTIPPLLGDTISWKDVVFEDGSGSVNTTDTIFWQRYRRGYFKYLIDSTKRQIKFSKQDWTRKSMELFTMNYEMPDNNTIRLSGKIRNDSIYTELKRSNRHFQLAERQFHWLSEYNR